MYAISDKVKPFKYIYYIIVIYLEIRKKFRFLKSKYQVQFSLVHA